MKQRILTEEDAASLWDEVTELFSPGAPVQERDLFAGRLEQLRMLMDVVQQRGRHGVVFGERGVGKTSIANVLSLVMRSLRRDTVAVKANADPHDSFLTLWKRVFKRLNHELARVGSESKVVVDDDEDDLTPDDVQLALSSLGRYAPIVVIDEFDRIGDKQLKRLMADTIKAFSDYSVPATLVLVGVAEDIGGLIREHESVARCIVQVRMPRMSQEELAQVIGSRYAKCGIKIDEEALWKVTYLARGLPYYAHLLGMHSARNAIQARTRDVTSVHVNAALSKAVVELDQSIKETYHLAVRSQRGDDTLYAPVLLACALARADEMGEFQQSAVADPLNRIVRGKNYRPTTFAFHMNEFCKPHRRSVLTVSGPERNLRYRFTDPLMQPFVILKGLADELVDDKTADIFAHRRQLQLLLDEPEESPRA